MNAKKIIISLVTWVAYTHSVDAVWGNRMHIGRKDNTPTVYGPLHSCTQSNIEDEFVIISTEKPISATKRVGQLYLEELPDTQNQNEHHGILRILAHLFPCFFSR